MNIITLKSASEMVNIELEKILKSNHLKYSKIDLDNNNSFYLKCSQADTDYNS